METGTLIAIGGKLYVYGYKFRLYHGVYEVLIDEDGNLTQTCTAVPFTDEELKDNTVNFTQKQWCGIIKQLIRNEYYEELTEEDIATAAEDIVYRCFALNMPKFHELQGYITEYMNR